MTSTVITKKGDTIKYSFPFTVLFRNKELFSMEIADMFKAAEEIFFNQPYSDTNETIKDILYNAALLKQMHNDYSLKKFTFLVYHYDGRHVDMKIVFDN